MKDNKLIKIISLVLAMLIVLIATIWLANMRREDEILQDSNGELKNLPEVMINATKSEIQKMFLLNNEVENKYVAVVRANSAQKIIENDDTLIGTFIIDVEALRQSYLVYYHHNQKLDDIIRTSNFDGDVSESLVFMCVSKQGHLIYDDSDCAKTGLADEDDLYLYIPGGESVLPSGEKVEFSFKRDKRVYAIVTGCNEIDDGVEKMARGWVESLGFEPNDFEYIVSLKYDNCLMR